MEDVPCNKCIGVPAVVVFHKTTKRFGVCRQCLDGMAAKNKLIQYVLGHQYSMSGISHYRELTRSLHQVVCKDNNENHKE